MSEKVIYWTIGLALYVLAIYIPDPYATVIMLISMGFISIGILGGRKGLHQHIQDIKEYGLNLPFMPM